ncbi:MAG: hypothetical protein IH899_18465 [Planctomycetes bacterium]|nr:hypothetical protein [Planctomycetota bacterium]
MTESDLVDFLLDEASNDQRMRVRAALADPDSDASRWMREMHDHFSMNPLSVDTELMEDSTYE